MSFNINISANSLHHLWSIVQQLKQEFFLEELRGHILQEPQVICNEAIRSSAFNKGQMRKIYADGICKKVQRQIHYCQQTDFQNMFQVYSL